MAIASHAKPSLARTHRSSDPDPLSKVVLDSCAAVTSMQHWQPSDPIHDPMPADFSEWPCLNWRPLGSLPCVHHEECDDDITIHPAMAHPSKKYLEKPV